MIEERRTFKNKVKDIKKSAIADFLIPKLKKEIGKDTYISAFEHLARADKMIKIQKN